jgi:hypothetical protein
VLSVGHDLQKEDTGALPRLIPALSLFFKKNVAPEVFDAPAVADPETTLAELRRQKEALQDVTHKVLYGATRGHVHDDTDCVHLDATRCGIAIQTMSRKLHRPVRHGLLATWIYRPVDNAIGTGRFDELLLFQDYLRLRTAKFRMCWCNPCFKNPTADFTMLLRDVTVIETGTTLVYPFIALPLIWAISLPLLWRSRCVASATGDRVAEMQVVGAAFGLGYIWFWLVFSVYQRPLTRFLLPAVLALAVAAWIAFTQVSFAGFVSAAAGIYGVGLSISAVRGWIRRPFVYFGVLVGSSRRSASTHGASPFWVRMARGQTITDIDEVVDCVRNAAKRSVQADLFYWKRGDSSNADEGAVNQSDMIHRAPESAVDVVERHVVSEGMAAAVRFCFDVMLAC